MDNMEEAISGVLNNPDMMQKIMEMAQSFGGNPQEEPKKETTESPSLSFDPSRLAEITGLLGKANIDKNQQNLLNALSPYLSNQRIHKLQKAMQAARLAELAGSVLGNNTISGR